MSRENLDQHAGHWLAGFVEAEGSFSIGPNNYGQSWSCRFSLTQRDDERDLILELQELTGLGVMRWRPAIGRARPQVVWSLGKIDECVELARILNRFPLRGKKRREFLIWTEAVEAWGKKSRGHNRWGRIEHLAGQLRAVREYRSEGPAALAQGDSEDLRWFTGGFVTGEGCFSFPTTAHPRFEVKVRRDDSPLIRLLQAQSQLGYVSEAAAYGGSRPSCSWKVLRHSELEELSVLLTGVLKGRRVRELEAWSKAATEYGEAIRNGRPRRAQVVDAARDEFRLARRYQPPDSTATLRAGLTRRDTALNAIERWARTETGLLSCTSYDRWRKESGPAPTRNTVAQLFGSWSTALREAGLADRAASTTRQRRARAAGRSNDRADASAERRALVKAAVRDLAENLGRLPTGKEYFEWRLDRRTDLPSQSTTYRLFPGGWRAVLSAAGFPSD